MKVKVEKVAPTRIFMGCELATLCNSGEKFVWVLSGSLLVLSVYDGNGNDAGQYSVELKGLMGHMAALHQQGVVS